MTLHVELVSPERILWTGDAEMVHRAAPSTAARSRFLTGHAPFVGALDIAKVVVRPPEGGDQVIAVHGGFVEVSHDQVTILSDVAELPEHIDVARARTAKEAAEAELRTDPDDEDAQLALRRADLRLTVAEMAPAAAAHR